MSLRTDKPQTHRNRWKRPGVSFRSGPPIQRATPSRNRSLPLPLLQFWRCLSSHHHQDLSPLSKQVIGTLFSGIADTALRGKVENYKTCILFLHFFKRLLVKYEWKTQKRIGQFRDQCSKVPNQKQLARLHEEGDVFIIPTMYFRQDVPNAKLETKNEKLHEAVNAKAERATALAYKHDFTFGGLSFWAQRNEWGDCIASGNISMNWRLLSATRYVADYLFFPKLMHTRIINHTHHFGSASRPLAPITPKPPLGFKRTELHRFPRDL